MVVRYLDNDIVRLYELDKPKKLENLVTLFWGDSVRIVDRRSGQDVVEIPRRIWDPTANRYVTKKFRAAVPKKARYRDESILKVRFVDVGQGDGAIIETPGGKVVLLDGGEEEYFRRYVNVGFSYVLATRPLRCAAIVVTHGDADHFAGLTSLALGYRTRDSPMITADRIYHNGLVKGSAKKDTEMFGKTVKVGDATFAVELHDDLGSVSDAKMNTPFRDWKQALRRMKQSNDALRISHLAYGGDAAFDFLRDEGIKMEVLGPIVEDAAGLPGLRFLRDPDSGRLSASHTINGHSVILRMTFGNVRFLFGADLNAEAESRLLDHAQATGKELTAEVLKVPHHGSADFDPRMIAAVSPIVSVVSSGDESTAKEYIHPRAGLMGALGRYSRPAVERPLVYVTEMVAFFERLGLIKAVALSSEGKEVRELGRYQNAYWKRQFGIVHVRTDGERVLVVTHSGRDDRKESYAFRVRSTGEIEIEPETNIV